MVDERQHPNEQVEIDSPAPIGRDLRSAGHLLDAETYQELLELRGFVAKLMDRELELEEGGDIAAVLGEWHAGVQEDLSQYQLEKSEGAALEAAYTSFALEGGSGERRRAHVHIDTRFGSLVQRVRSTTQLMLDRVAEGRLRSFITTAQRYGLTWRRSRTLPFPHPLPYMSPPPTTANGRYAEEGGVIEAALRFPLTRPAPGVDLYIDWFSQGPSSDGFWVLGWATVNLYNSRRYLRINLNARAYPQFSDNVWAGTIVHEILHNLGWGHPDGGYVPSVAIVNYDRCIRSTTGLRLDAEGDYGDVMEDAKLIR